MSNLPNKSLPDPAVQRNFHALDQRAQEIASGVGIQDGAITQDKLAPIEWHEVGGSGEPAFASGWTNHTDGYPVSFGKDALGFVHLRGIADGPAGGTGTVFTLPAGYRPAELVSFAVHGNLTVAIVNVTNAGVVSVGAGSGSSILALDGVSFYAEQ